MEYELEKTRLEGFETVLDTGLTREETLEMIVPDACPDILRVVETDGRVLIGRREAVAGRVELTGTFQLCVLYVPDGESGVRHLDVTIPFSCEAEGKDVGPECQVVVSAELCRADTRAVNPRKILARAEASVQISVFAPRARVVTTRVAPLMAEQVEQLTQEREVYLTACVEEKPFTCSDEVSLPSGKPACSELLRSRVNLSRGESKIIGSKLIFKGGVELSFLYRGEDGGLHTAGAELPFSQIMEVTGVGEEAECELTLALTGAMCTLAYGDDGRTVSVTVDALAQAVVRESRVVSALADAYSTRESLDCEWEQFPMEGRLDRGVRSQNVREIYELPGLVQDVLSCRLALGGVTQSREGSQLTLTARGELRLLYTGEGGEPYGASIPVEVACPLELEEECVCLCRCEGVGDVYATPAPGGLEARFTLDFRYCALKRWELTALSALYPGEAPQEAGEQPSLVLRMLERGERLWDVAKGCSTTVADIMGANQLEEESQARGRLLLIPRKR